MQKIKNIITIVLFLGVLGAFFAINIFKAPDELSYSERRRLAQLPEVSIETVFKGDAMRDFNDYAVDQFVWREQFRTLKAVIDINMWQKSDNNAIFTIGDYVFKTEYPLRENSIKRLCNINNYIYEQYLQGMNVKYAFIPDKNYYINDTHRHLTIDYDMMKQIIRENTLAEIDEIELFDYLSLDSYYMTDAHWKQETLGDVTDAIADSFGVTLQAGDFSGRYNPSDFRQEHYFPFYGAYYGQSALSVQPDELIYMVSDITENAVVTSVEYPGKTLDVYDEAQLGGMDSYNLFMHGPQAIIRAENPLNPDAKELVIFRDSFGSSISPLLLSAYSAVTLADLRYITPELIGQFIEFTDQDVLFLYSAGVYNNSDSMRAPAREEFISPFVTRAIVEE